jgi:CDP-glucose 4,6-dehydratase
VTTDKVYANKEWLWPYREDEALGGHDPYSSSKACCELLAQSYAASFFPADKYDEHGLALATARAGNVLGGGDFAPERLIPDVLKAWTADEPVTLRYPQAVRPWQHALEPLAGYLQLAAGLYEQGPEYAGAWNFGPGEADMRSVGEVVELLAIAGHRLAVCASKKRTARGRSAAPGQQSRPSGAGLAAALVVAAVPDPDPRLASGVAERR